MTPDPFAALPADADCYDCCDSERLSHESPEEAIEEWLDWRVGRDDDVHEIILKRERVTVTAYKRDAITEREIDRTVDHVIDRLIEDFDEEHGDPEGDSGDVLSKSETVEIRPLFDTAVRAFYERTTVWNCSRVGEVTIDAAQIEAVMRESYPEYFRDMDPPVDEDRREGTS